MLKKFFISMLGTIAGLWIVLVILFLLGVTSMASLFTSKSDDLKIDDNSVLYINLSGEIPERKQSVDIWQVLRNEQSDADALCDIVSSIRTAANDSKISGIYIDANGSTLGTASREEIVSALKDFKTSGKWVVAYADSYSQGDYVVSCLADSVFLNPLGSVNVRGIATSVPFFKKMLDKVGVKVQVVRVGTYKSAVEPFMAKQMSPASRLQSQQMIDTMWTYMADVVSANRGVKHSAIDEWADSMMFTRPAEYSLKHGVVTSLKYRRQVEDYIRTLCFVDDDDELPLVTPSQYVALNNTLKESKNIKRDHIAVLYAVGDIVDDGEGGIVGKTMVSQIIDLANDENVKGLVMRVNSGGGSAFASEQIWEALEYFKSKGKPFYVSMGDAAASGGYYISSDADMIFADRTTLTGSIGVFGLIPDFSDLVTDKFGIKFETVTTNANATFPSGVKPMTPQQYAAMQSSVEDIYDTFTKRVAAGRKMSQDSVKAIAEGRVWVGSAAVKLGLVDKLGGLNDAVKAMAEKLGIDDDCIVAYPQVDESVFAQILKAATQDANVVGIKVDSYTMRLARFIEYLHSMPYVQARMIPMEFDN